MPNKVEDELKKKKNIMKNKKRSHNEMTKIEEYPFKIDRSNEFNKTNGEIVTIIDKLRIIEK